MRLSGFATGMDIQQMVDDLMRAERQPLDRMVQNRELLEWKRDDYRAANIEFNKLRQQLFDGVMRQANMEAKDVTSSNASLVTATATASANNGTWNISEVSQLASSAYNVGTGAVTGEANSSIAMNESIGSQSEFFSAVDGEEDAFEFSITTFTSDGEQTETFTFDGTSTFKEVIDEVNSSGVGVSMMYDPVSDRVSITRTETGNFNEGESAEDYFGSEMVFEGAFLTEDLHLNNAYEDESGEVQMFEQGGQNAQFTINGLETERHSNTFTIDGVSITLHNEFENAVNLDVSTRVDDIFDTVMSFVDDYNEVLESMNGKLTEERFRDYRPLTEEQKQAMSEREVELWEERARSGSLRNDRTISSGLERMRTDIYSAVNIEGASYTHISQIGITTSSNYMDRGRLQVDEEALRAAIEADPQAVYQMFTADGDSYEEQGIARRMRESLQGTIGQISDQAGQAGSTNNHTIGREIDNENDRITNFERRLQQIEQRYWAQFNAMEAAVHRANNQAESLFAQLNGGQMM